MNFQKSIIFFFYFFLAGTVATANCLTFDENERLSNFCILESVKDTILDEHTALNLALKLKREGYFGGLKTSDWSTTLYPEIGYSSNINGGTPNKPLVLGGLDFWGDPNLIKQDGIISTLQVRANNRSTFDEGNYLQTDLYASYSYSPKYNNSFSKAGIESCFSDKITLKNSIDICASSSIQNKEISENRSNTLSLNFGNLSFNENIGFSEGKLGIIHLGSDEYSQNQLVLSWDTIHRKNLFSAIRFRVGDPVSDQLALRYGLDIDISKIIMNRKISFKLSNEINDGGILFGIDRSDVINKLNLQTVISQNASIQVGYTSHNSSIDYFDESYPTLSLTMSW